MPKESHTDEPVSLEIAPQVALSAMESGQIRALVATAKEFPRRLSKCVDAAISLATMDEETAASCYYSVPRGGKDISGPSIRCAEIIASSWGNIRAGSRVLGNDGRVIKSQAFCHDLENNVFFAIEKDRKITDKHGKTYNEDMIVVTGNACASIALRDAIFKCIPAVVRQKVYDASRACAAGNMETLSARRTKQVDWFVNTKKIPLERVLAAVGAARIEDIDLDKMRTLLGLGTALNENHTTIDEAFPMLPTKPQFEGEKKPETTRARKAGDPVKEDDNLDMTQTTETPKGTKKATTMPPRANPREALANLMTASKVGDAGVLKYLKANGNDAGSVEMLDEPTVVELVKIWPDIVGELDKTF